MACPGGRGLSRSSSAHRLPRGGHAAGRCSLRARGGRCGEGCAARGAEWGQRRPHPARRDGGPARHTAQEGGAGGAAARERGGERRWCAGHSHAPRYVRGCRPPSACGSHIRVGRSVRRRRRLSLMGRPPARFQKRAGFGARAGAGLRGSVGRGGGEGASSDGPHQSVPTHFIANALSAARSTAATTATAPGGLVPLLKAAVLLLEIGLGVELAVGVLALLVGATAAAAAAAGRLP